MANSRREPPFDLRSSLGFQLNRLAAAMRADFAGRLAEHGALVSEWALLAAVRDGAETPMAVAKLMALDPAAVTRTLDRVVQRGFIERTQSTADARSFTLRLSDDGKRLAATLAREAQHTNERFLSVLSERERAILPELLGRMFDERRSDKIPQWPAPSSTFGPVLPVRRSRRRNRDNSAPSA